MFRSRDRFFLVPYEPAQETDPGECRNHAVLPAAEALLLFTEYEEENLCERLTHAGASLRAGKKNRRTWRDTMEILYRRCAGLDVHKKTIKVCLLIRENDGQIRKEFRTYGTTTQELQARADWLREPGCTHV